MKVKINELTKGQKLLMHSYILLAGARNSGVKVHLSNSMDRAMSDICHELDCSDVEFYEIMIEFQVALDCGPN